MRRIAFTQIGGRGWMGGLNYQTNLLSALVTNAGHRIKPVLFLGNDTDQAVLERFQQIQDLEIVQSTVFDQKHKHTRLINALLLGVDAQALKLFKQHAIDVVFESANFYGWRFPIKSIAWIPDMQHQRLRHYFGFFAFWRREIGFRMQILGGRHIMLSSDDARADFQHFYRIPQQRLHVVRFAVPIKARTFDVDVLLSRYGLPEHFFYLPNQFWRHKNHECVIHALAIAKQAGHEIVVAVSGNTNDPRDAEYFPNLLALANRLGVEKNFRVLGLIPYEDVQALMTSCIALLNPSRFEGWSTTVEEAKALNVEMLLSDINVHREQAGEQAQYFNVDDAEHLAEILKRHVIRPQAPRLQQEQTVVERACKGMADFSASFASMVEEVAGEV